jgi:hypothetical protein
VLLVDALAKRQPSCYKPFKQFWGYFMKLTVAKRFLVLSTLILTSSISFASVNTYFHIVLNKDLTDSLANQCADQVCNIANANGADGYCEEAPEEKLVITSNLTQDGVTQIQSLSCVESVNVTPPLP